jgi:hypothetical protein
MAAGKPVESRPFPPPGEQGTYGVGATSEEPAGREDAALIRKLYGVLAPAALAVIHEWRDTSLDTTVNTDGHTLCAAEASFRIADPSQVWSSLLSHPDMDDMDDIGGMGDDGTGDALVWWGRPLHTDELRRVDAELEMVRDEFIEAYHDVHELDEFGDAAEGRRWARGQVFIHGYRLHLETNSVERVDAFCDLMRELGVEPDLVERKVLGPAPDLSLRRGNTLPHLALDFDEIQDWAVDWLDDPMPGLPGRSPAQAVRRAGNHAMVETALRELEHDVDRRARVGLLTPDVGYLRRGLGLPRMKFFGRAARLAGRLW